MFIISSQKFKGYNSKKEKYYINYDNFSYVKINKNYIFMFEGNLYPDIKYKIEDIIKYFETEKNKTNFKKFKGKYSGVFIDLHKNKVYFFNDQLGLRDIFYFIDEDNFVISNNYSEILDNINFTYNDVDLSSLKEFLVFEYPLLDKTFIKNIKILPLSSIYTIKKNNKLNKFNYWEYKLIENKNYDTNESIEKLDKLFQQSFKRIIKTDGINKTYGLGLSGGRDSRLVAYYAKKNNIKLKTFVYGEPNSDATHISKLIAKKLQFNNKKIGYDKNFIKYAKYSIRFNPMMNIQYSWYHSTYDILPKFDILLTGFNGDNQFGSHLLTNKKLSNKIVANKLINKYGLPTLKINHKNISTFLKKINLSTFNKTENFNFNFRQLKFIKNNPAFNYLGKYQGISIFEDIDLIEFLLTIPYLWKKDLKLYKLFFEQKIPELANIRQANESNFKNKYLSFIDKYLRYIDTNLLETDLFFRKNTSSLKKWLKNNDYFYAYCKKIIDIENKYFWKNFDEFNLSGLLEKIYKGKATNNVFKKEIYLFFRLLTIKLFLDTYISQRKEI